MSLRPAMQPASPNSSPVSEPSARRATIHTRSRRWGAPTAQAPTTDAQQAYPASSRPASTTSIPRVRRKGTFSATTQRGRNSVMSRSISNQSRDRGSSSPLPSPAPEMPWHGNPPTMASTGPTRLRTASPVSVSMSSWHQTPGQCWPNTRRQNSSVSQNPTVRNPPVRSRPSEIPPMPLNKSSTRITSPPTPARSPAGSRAACRSRPSRESTRPACGCRAAPRPPRTPRRSG